jgi:uncharacterized protein (TIGR02145 family)
MKKIKASSLLLYFLLIPFLLFSQSPQSIPYQAVLRNSDGSVMANTSLNITLMVHNATATGTVVYEESHTTSSNAVGLININIGSGTATTGAFNTIEWEGAAKFLHVQMDAGNGLIDLGTQQMMSVPYALHTSQVAIRVSSSGDSLFVGNQFSIVPGISAANYPAGPETGETLLPGNALCTTSPISVSSCNGQTNLVYQSATYDLVEIGGQCWLGDNLNATTLNDGTPIANITDNTTWSTTTAPAYCYYQNNTAYQTLFGNLYNYATIQTNKLCPTGWHVPSDCEWMYMEGSLGLSIADQQIGTGFRGTTEGDALKSLDGWNVPHTVHNNSTGFTALPGGYRFTTGTFNGRTLYGYWATSTPDGTTGNVWNRKLNVGNSNISRAANSSVQGYSVRCIKD